MHSIVAVTIYVQVLELISLYGADYFFKITMISSKSHYALLAGMTFVFLFLPACQFAQREHLMFIATMPYWCLAVARANKANIHFFAALLAGLLAAVGFALKPFFLIPFVFVELYLIVAWRSFWTIFRVETVTIGLFLITYLLSIILSCDTPIIVVLSASNRKNLPDSRILRRISLTDGTVGYEYTSGSFLL